MVVDFPVKKYSMLHSVVERLNLSRRPVLEYELI